MVNLKLDPEQVEFLEAALEKACDNEADGEYLQAYAEILETLRSKVEAFHSGK